MKNFLLLSLLLIIYSIEPAEKRPAPKDGEPAGKLQRIAQSSDALTEAVQQTQVPIPVAIPPIQMAYNLPIEPPSALEIQWQQFSLLKRLADLQQQQIAELLEQTRKLEEKNQALMALSLSSQQSSVAQAQCTEPVLTDKQKHAKARKEKLAEEKAQEINHYCQHPDCHNHYKTRLAQYLVAHYATAHQEKIPLHKARTFTNQPEYSAGGLKTGAKYCCKIEGCVSSMAVGGTPRYAALRKHYKNVHGIILATGTTKEGRKIQKSFEIITTPVQTQQEDEYDEQLEDEEDGN